MEKRTLGRTGLEVSVLGMGGLYVSSAGDLGRDEGCRAARRALELGVNYVDTAPSYRDSEEVLGIALEGVPQPYLLATKLGGRPQPFNPQDKDILRRSVDESLRLLKRDYIDVLLVHEPDRPGTVRLVDRLRQFSRTRLRSAGRIESGEDYPIHWTRWHHRLSAATHHGNGKFRCRSDSVQLQSTLARSDHLDLP